MAHSCIPKQPSCAERFALTVSSRSIDDRSGRCESTYSPDTVTPGSLEVELESSTYPFSPKYDEDSTPLRMQPKPGCQRRKADGRCE